MSRKSEEARKTLQSLDLEKIAKAGIHRELKSASVGHHIVTYPEIHESKPASWRTVLNKTDYKRDLALYFHIPFCSSRCTYCNYGLLTGADEKTMQRYVSALFDEMGIFSGTSEFRNSHIHSIYIGGGTPTLLPMEELARLIDSIKVLLRYDDGIEFTVEASPLTLLAEDGMDKLQAMRQLGVNRISLGIQSFSDPILELMNRRYTGREAILAIKKLAKAFENFNLDLILGYPGTAPESWEQDLGIASMLAPSVTTYPFMMGFMYLNNGQYLSNEESLTLSIMSMQHFAGEGWIQDPVWWFAKDEDHAYKQQMHKWKHNGEQHAFGVYGYSYVNGRQYYNIRSMGRYHKDGIDHWMNDYLCAIHSGNLPIESASPILSNKEKARRSLVFGIK